MKTRPWIVLAAALILQLSLAGCASMKPENKQGQRASVVEFLFPGTDGTTQVAYTTVAEIKVPFRVGIGFVPDHADPRFAISEAQRQEMLGRVREAFQKYPFISSIEMVPSSYLTGGGGYASVDSVARLLSLDSLVLLSYDQVQHADANGWSALYWTGIGLYTVPGDRYAIFTLLDAVVLDVKSRKVLLRAGGTSEVNGSATAIGFGAVARDARTHGFDQALDRLIPGLHAQVKAFRERAPGDKGIRLDLPPGYDPNAVKAAAR